MSKIHFHKRETARERELDISRILEKHEGMEMKERELEKGMRKRL